MTEEENEKVSMPFDGGENTYLSLVVVSWCWGLRRIQDFS